jgi:hypothetical protein
MKRFFIGLLALCLSGFFCNEVSAIGVWLGGRITQAPWQGQQFLYIKINHVRYTIMPGVKIQFLYKVDGATNKATIGVSSLHAGDTVAVMAEGNRIYQIEKTR